MKNLLFLFLLMLGNMVFSQSEVAFARYKIVYTPPSPAENLKHQNPELYDDILTVSKAVSNLEIGIYMNESKSFQFVIDSGVTGESKFILSLARIKIPGYDYTYIEKESGKYYNQFRFKKNEIVEESDLLSHLHWEITSETKEIDGYKCYKAVSHLYDDDPEYGGENVTAWFCPDIPYPFGPHKYGGLPGLVIELHKTDMVLRLKNLEFKVHIYDEKLAKMFAQRPEVAKSMSERQLTDYILSNYKN